ncbi:hypothetical protein GYMLUDRAFT_64182 [Collybiopsis luxurians FD-317 M1]|uniref:Unplaced genomic scaffold GYMLUscaffold_93, whole genome shotgun sequence n=1 Tax=Collybiopsis luxurians FD-317 M1 TaxID=944289 RepID=A0A0D0BSH7_9AGAR|nr:hypothetical protein GYMLUDRAFT_64182 [Collybiopsis luxurians FD-317 M1]
MPDWNSKVVQKQHLPNGIVADLYRHHMQVPSREKIHQLLLASTSPSMEFSQNSSMFLIQLGLAIEHSQQWIKGKKALNQTETVRKEIVMPGVQDLVLSISSDLELENELLYLPSSLLPNDQQTRNSEELAKLEGRIHVGELFDSIIFVRNAAKYKSLAYKDKAENVRGSNASTRSALQIKRIEVELLCCILDYQRVRSALIQLKEFTSDQLPVMTVESTYQCPTTHACQLGNSHRADGQLYTLAVEFSNSDFPDKGVEDVFSAGSQDSYPSQPKPVSGRKVEAALKDNGWIWKPESTFTLLGVYVDDISTFEDKSDQIMHFCAKAKMEHWREAWRKMGDCNAPSPSCNYKTGSFGHTAFAYCQSKMYEELYTHCLRSYRELSFENIPEGKILADVVAEQRAWQEAEDELIIQVEIRAAQEFLNVVEENSLAI